METGAVWGCTWGELLEFIRISNERRRRERQHASSIAFHQAHLICRLLSGSETVRLYEAFPYWSDEEINCFRLDELQKLLQEKRTKGGTNP